MSLFAILQSGSAALSAQGRALQTTANNVANAETAGYTRQRTELTTRSPLNRGGLLLGRGVAANTVSSAYDVFAQRQVLTGISHDGYAQSRGASMRSIEAVLSEGEDGNIGQRLSELFDAFSMMEADPTSPALRLRVLAAGDGFATAVRRGADALQTQQSDANESLTSMTGRVNELSGTVAALNASITNLESGGDLANDLRVQRMQAVEQLSAFGPVTTKERADGGLAVLFGGHTLVEGGEARARSTQQDPTTGDVSIRISQGASTFDITKSVTGPNSGTMGAALYERDVTTQGLIDQLDALAFGVATTVNATHAAGFGLDGSTGADFFSAPTQQGGAAATMTLDGAMSANPDRVAASGSATTVPGGNTNAAALAALASQLSMAGGTRTFSSYYGELLSSLGGDAAQAYADESRSALQLSVAFDARDATSAVSLEEEAIDLIRFQEAYQAAARVVSSANALFDDLLSIVS